MSAPATSEIESSSLLPTPVVNDMGRGKSIEEWDEWTERLLVEKAYNGNGHGRSLDIEVRRLPTPTSRDWKGRNQRDDDSCLPGAVDKLPTPTLSDAKGSRNETCARREDSTGNPGTTLTDVFWSPEQQRLLPTPRTNTGTGSSHHGDGGPDLQTALSDLGVLTRQPSDDTPE